MPGNAQAVPTDPAHTLRWAWPRCHQLEAGVSMGLSMVTTEQDILDIRPAELLGRQ